MPRVGCGVAWRGPGAARGSAEAARMDGQDRNRTARLLHEN